jgi:CBS domain-containing protein
VHLPPAVHDRGESGTPVSQIMYVDAPVVDAAVRLRDIPSTAPACAVLRKVAPAAGLSHAEIRRAAGRGNAADEEALLIDGRGEVPHLHPDHSIEEALDRMYESEVEALAVVDRGNVTQVRGGVSLEW